MSFFLTLRARANTIMRLHTAGATAERATAARTLARDLIAATHQRPAAPLPPIALPCPPHQHTRRTGN